MQASCICHFYGFYQDYFLLFALFSFVGSVCDNCHKDAVCLYGQCICKNGFVGNGKICKSKYNAGMQNLLMSFLLILF